MNKSGPVNAVLIGAGERGTFVYGQYALQNPGDLRIVAVAEPDEGRRKRLAERHGLKSNQCFDSWQSLLNSKLEADAAIIATLDRQHLEPAIKALETRFHVLLEKPMAVDPVECVRIVRASQSAGTMLMIAHVLRYTPFFRTVKEIVESGRLGDIVAIEHRENVSHWHMAHSFVRGNWRNSDETAPMILAKCCHDLDILVWMMSHARPVRVQSMGSLMHFKRDNAPEGAPERCIEGCPAEETCPFFAPRLYLDMSRTDNFISAMGVDMSYEGRLQSLKNGPYGRCVYFCDNNVVDHQSVNIEFDSGTVATLIMHGHSHEEGRTMRYDGTLATLRGNFPLHSEPEIVVHDHRSGRADRIEIPPAPPGGHGGGDTGLLKAFVKGLSGDVHDLNTSAEISLLSHLLAFAAEEARQSGRSLDVAEFTRDLDKRSLNLVVGG